MNALERAVADHAAETRALRRELATFVARQTAILEGEICEELLAPTVPVSNSQAITDTFAAQTSSVEVITGFFVVVMASSTAVTLQLGERSIPIGNATELIAPIILKVRDQTRKLTYTAPSSLGSSPFGAYVAVWGFASASTNAPGRLH